MLGSQEMSKASYQPKHTSDVVGGGVGCGVGRRVASPMHGFMSLEEREFNGTDEEWARMEKEAETNKATSTSRV